MSELHNFLASGILELYVMGQATPEECAYVEKMTQTHEEVRRELDTIQTTLEHYTRRQAITPDPTIKPFLMATIDYMERLQQGEVPSFPPALHEGSKPEDFDEWLHRADLQLQPPFNEIQARIIGFTPEMTTAIVWLEHGAPPEIHTTELEKFLIVEGTCNIVVDGQDNHLQPGNVFSIPLHVSHHVRVTSAVPCKIVLQRVAA